MFLLIFASQFVTTELTPLDGEESAQTLSVLDIDG